MLLCIPKSMPTSLLAHLPFPSHVIMTMFACRLHPRICNKAATQAIDARVLLVSKFGDCIFHRLCSRLVPYVNRCPHLSLHRCRCPIHRCYLSLICIPPSLPTSLFALLPFPSSSFMTFFASRLYPRTCNKVLVAATQAIEASLCWIEARRLHIPSFV